MTTIEQRPVPPVEIDINDGRLYDDPWDTYRWLRDNDTRYWDWKGEGEARLNLVFLRGDKEIRQEFNFRRRKV